MFFRDSKTIERLEDHELASYLVRACALYQALLPSNSIRNEIASDVQSIHQELRRRNDLRQQEQATQQPLAA